MYNNYLDNSLMSLDSSDRNRSRTNSLTKVTEPKNVFKKNSSPDLSLVKRRSSFQMIELLENKSKSIIEASSEHSHASSVKQKFLGVVR